MTFTLVNTMMLWICTLIAATALWPIYRSTSLVILVIVALAAGSAVAIFGAYFQLKSPLIMLFSAAVFLLIGVPLAVPGSAQNGVFSTIEGLRELVAGVALSWKQLLTITLPVGDYQALLVPALVLILGSTVVGLSVALRAPRPELAVVAPIVVFVAATALGPQSSDQSLWAPITLFVGLLLWLLWLRWYRRQGSIRALPASARRSKTTRSVPGWIVSGFQTFISALALMAVASGVAAVAASVFPPSADRSVLRTALVQPFDPRDYVSPLSGFRSYWQPALAEVPLFEVRGLPKGSRIRLATLDTYDGVVYAVGSEQVTSESGTFVRVPSTVDQSGVSGREETVSITIGQYQGVWVPTIGLVESVDFTSGDTARLRDDFYYNNTSGTAAVVGGLSRGDAYTVTAVVPAQPIAAEFSALEPGSASVPAPAQVPDELIATLDQYTTGVTGPGPRLVAMLSGLRKDGYISHGVEDDQPASRSGHAVDRIVQLFTEPRMIGDAEQYAVAAAVMAHEIGFPARVVLGFVPSSAQVTGSDVSAWIEIHTAKFGWVTIDPTPPIREIPEEIPQDKTQVARPQTIVPPPLVESDTLERQITRDSEQQQAPEVNLVLQVVLAVLGVIGWVVVAVAVLLSPFLLVIAAKMRRRRLRRRAASPIHRITGGWREFEDAVADHGLTPVASATRSQVAAVAGGQRSEILAMITDRAVFAPETSTEADADSVWDAVDELQASLDQDLSRWQRLRTRISLRSLGISRIKNSARREGGEKL
ncbi:MAG: transglutaminase-like domain-containing protein [Rhodoglobus sp.]